MSWTETNKQLPEEGLMVLGYHKEWVHPDFNPKGIRECFLNMDDGEEIWSSSEYDNDQDSWDTVSVNHYYDQGEITFNPTHWMELPEPPGVIKPEVCIECKGLGIKTEYYGMAYPSKTVNCSTCNGTGKTISK